MPKLVSVDTHRDGSSNSVYEHVAKSYNSLLKILDESLLLLDSELNQEIGSAKKFLKNTKYAYYNNMFIAHRHFVQDYDRIFF